MFKNWWNEQKTALDRTPVNSIKETTKTRLIIVCLAALISSSSFLFALATGSQEGFLFCAMYIASTAIGVLLFKRFLPPLLVAVVYLTFPRLQSQQDHLSVIRLEN